MNSVINVISTTNKAEYFALPKPPEEVSAAPFDDFSIAFTQAMQSGIRQTTQIAGSSLSGMPTGTMSIHDSGFETMILQAASHGATEDAQIALFMLMMLMQAGSDSELSMKMQMMTTIIMQMQGSRQALRENATLPGFNPVALDSDDRQVFHRSLLALSDTGQAILPIEAWRPATPAITSDASNRSPEIYRAVVDQFRVETAERYRPFRNGNTFCNIFVWDVTRAMGAEVPHYTDPVTGDPMFYPDVVGARSMGAIATCQWLRSHGERFGWREVDAQTAQWHANQGRPAITSAGSLGHVQVVVPSTSRGFDPVSGVTIAQAGRINSNYMHISGIYSSNALQNSVRYWIHE
ncbi:MAG: hypothetical protein FWC66_05485 [Oscillospiraceae bacterium]|nr:hypothetical protein [Oscillospiraceae bacterium]